MAECFGAERHAPQTASVDRIGHQSAKSGQPEHALESPTVNLPFRSCMTFTDTT